MVAVPDGDHLRNQAVVADPYRLLGADRAVMPEDRSRTDDELTLTLDASYCRSRMQRSPNMTFAPGSMLIVRPRRMSQRAPNSARGHLARASSRAPSLRAPGKDALRQPRHADPRLARERTQTRAPGPTSRGYPLAVHRRLKARAVSAIAVSDKAFRVDDVHALVAAERLEAARRRGHDRAAASEVLKALDGVQAERELVYTMGADQDVGGRHPSRNVGVRDAPVKDDPLGRLEQVPRRVVEVIRPDEVNCPGAVHRKLCQAAEVEPLVVQCSDIHGVRARPGEIGVVGRQRGPRRRRRCGSPSR